MRDLRLLATIARTLQRSYDAKYESPSKVEGKKMTTTKTTLNSASDPMDIQEQITAWKVMMANLKSMLEQQSQIFSK